jgi:hypothetical protein
VIVEPTHAAGDEIETIEEVRRHQHPGHAVADGVLVADAVLAQRP